jgi:hypothetical protein
MAAGLVLALAACGGGGSLDGGGDDSSSSSSSDDLEDLLGQLGLDADDLEGLDLEELENLDESDFEGDFGDLGALAEIFGALGLEELIEENAEGDVDVEFGEDGLSVESEDGTFSIDEDGSFSVTDEDGEETTGEIDIDGSDGDMSIESDEGSVEFSSGSELPEDWPTDVPEPEGVAIQQAMTFSEDEGSSIIVSGSIEGSGEEWANAYGGQLEGAGFEEESKFTSGGDVTAFYRRGTMGIAVVSITTDVGTTISVSITNDQ